MYKDIEHTFQLNNNYRTFNIRSEEPDGFDWSEVGIRTKDVQTGDAQKELYRQYLSRSVKTGEYIPEALTRANMLSDIVNFYLSSTDTDLDKLKHFGSLLISEITQFVNSVTSGNYNVLAV
jgi:hypothetical protein